MIIWVASYPRSGNTLFRLLLNRLWGLPTYSVYPRRPDAPLRNRKMAEFIGTSPMQQPLERLAAALDTFPED